MAKEFICPQGHRWVPASTADPGSAFACPVCGSFSLTIPPQAKAANQTGKKTEPQDPCGETIAAPTTPPQAYTHPASPEPRPDIPGYQLFEEIGRGGMGVVYRARQLSHNRTVALKVIRQDRLTHEEAVKRFRRETQVAERLAHLNLVLVLDSDHEGDLHYLVMEYVRGETLQQFVETHGPLPVPLACEYIRQAVEGLGHAWQQGLVHRDVKPANLMVTEIPVPTGGGSPKVRQVIKILDMGVARLYPLNESPVESLTTLTQPNSVLGTADFIAPEQLEDPHSADYRADLYSLGCTFYYLLTGQVPFRGGTLIQKLDRQRWENPPSVDQLRKEIPKEIAGIVRKLMFKHPDDRYQGAGELLAHLQGYLQTGHFQGYSEVHRSREALVLQGHEGGVWCVTVSADGQRILSGGQDRTVRLWDPAGKQEVSRFDNPNEILSLAFAPNGAHFVTASGAGLRLRELDTGKELQRFQGHTDSVRCVRLTRDGQTLVSCSDDRTVRVWEVRSGREMLRFARHRDKVLRLSISPDDQSVLSGGRGQHLRLWNLKTGQEEKAFVTPTGQILGVDFSPGGLLGLSTHFDTFLRVWDLHTGKEFRRLRGHRQMVTAGLFTRDGQWIFSGSKDHTVRLWDLPSGAELAVFEGHENGVTCLALSPRADYFVSSGLDGNLRVWPFPGQKSLP